MTNAHSLAAAWRNMARPRLLVVGDLMLDRYTWGSTQRVSPEAPVLVLQADHEEVRLGGAASVANLLRVLEGEVVLAGVLGNDPSRRVARRLIDDAGIDGRLVIMDGGRPTTVKERFMGRAANRHPHQILRVDRETNAPIPTTHEELLIASVQAELAGCQALLISDYGKGVCTPRLLEAVILAARAANVPVLVDPARGADYRSYRSANLVKPNRAGAVAASGMAISTPRDALAAAEFLCREHQLGATVITLDQDGMALANPGSMGRLFPTQARSVYDITGAGDMALAMLGLCQGAGLDLCLSVELANVAAGLQVERLGVEPVTREELSAALNSDSLSAASDYGNDLQIGRKFVDASQLPRLTTELRRVRSHIVFTNGCFDLLHAGHVTYLQQAAALGDVLIVGLNSDASVRRCKGAGRPVIGESDRALLLAALECVDFVVIFDDETPEDLLRTIRPDVLVKGGTYAVEQVVGREFVESYGGQVCVVGKVEGVSTTNIVRQLQDARD